MYNNFKHPSPADKSATSPARGEVGRSMIEMLGVLAIIAVLSVGGIAGYSKAMEKFRVNKLITEYSDVIRNLIEYREPILKTNPASQTGFTSVMFALNIVPETWQRTNEIWLQDSVGNSSAFYTNTYEFGKGIAIDIYFGGRTTNDDNKIVTANFSEKLCVEFFNNLIKPLSDSLFSSNVFYLGDNWTGTTFWGGKYCRANDKCLSNATLADFQSACKICEGKNRQCNIGLKF